MKDPATSMSHRRVCGLAFALLNATLVGAAEGQTTAYVGATLIDGAGGPPVRDAVVVVTDSTILCAAARAVCLPQAERVRARIVDVSGTWIIPGLIDVSVQVTWSTTDSAHQMLVGLLRAGVTTVRDVGSFADPNWRTASYAVGQGEVERIARLAQARARDTPPGPRLVYCGPGLSSSDALFPPDPAYRPIGIRLRSATNLGEVVRYLVSRGASCIRLYASAGSRSAPLATSARQAREILQAARDQGVAGIGVAPTAFLPMDTLLAWPWREFHRFGFAVEDLLPPERRAGLPANPWARKLVSIARFDPDAPQAAAMAARVSQQGFAWVPIMREMREACDEVCWPLAPSMSPADSALVRDAFFDLRSPPRSLKDSVDATRAAGVRFANGWLSLLHRAGVRVLAGSNGPHPGVNTDLHTELEYLVDAGLSPAEALAAATRHAAAALGLGHRIGVLGRGMAADFLVLDADPLANIRSVRALRHVVINGTLLNSDRSIRRLP